WAELSAITREGCPVTSESLVVASLAILPEPIVIMLDVLPITPNILAILLDLAPDVPASSPQVCPVAIQGLPLGRESLVVAGWAVLAKIMPVMAHTLVHLSAVLSAGA